MKGDAPDSFYTYIRRRFDFSEGHCYYNGIGELF